jgi:hypothetical protein
MALFKQNDKLMHVVSFIIVLLLSIVIVILEPSLLKDAPTSLGTIGSFATAYGVIFAILELRRAKAASQQAKDEAKKVFFAVTGLVTAREIVECQATIQLAVASIDEGKAIPSAVLCQVTRLYSQLFHKEMIDEHSTHRKNRSFIESYSHNPNASSNGAVPKNTKRALIMISSDLGQLQGATKNFTEQVI